MTRVIDGLELVETVFDWPGIGYALVNSVLAQDFPVVQFVFVVFANFAIYVLNARIDPPVAINQ